jgi:hyaluronoglucosaminidase
LCPLQVSACASAGVTFVYAIAPGLDMQHWDPKERALLQAKIQQLVAMGVTAFAMLFDDIPDALSEQDAAVFSTQVLVVCVCVR